MSIIRCKECGNMVSDRAKACPHCGAPIDLTLSCGEEGSISPKFPNNEDYDIEQESYPYHASNKNNSNTWMWVLITILVVLLSVIGYILVENNHSTNSRDRRIDFSQTDQKESVQDQQTHVADTKHDEAVAQLKELLAKTDGMKFGDDKMALTRCNYDEKKNIVEFHYTQRVFTRSEGTPDLIAELTNTMRKSRKEAIKEIKVLMRLMEPLRPTIRDIIYYPDGSEAYTYDIKYNDLYYNN